MKKKVLVTGASGYLGGRLCYALLNQGYHVKAFVRRTSDLSSLPIPHSGDHSHSGALELAYGDVVDFGSLLDACTGCHVIFHVAALVDPWIPDPSRFITMHPGKFFCTEYEKSKVIADKIALEAASEGVPIVPVYPGVVYGPGKLTTGNAVARMLIERFNGRLPGYVGQGNDIVSFGHVDDVVEGHIGAENGRLGERYLLTGENASLNNVFDVAASITGTSRPKFTIPLIVIEAYGWLSVLFSRIIGKLPIISPPMVDILRHQWAYSCDKAKAELNYDPRSLAKGLAEVLPWLKSSNSIKY